MSKHKNWIGVIVTVAIFSIGVLFGVANAGDSLQGFNYDDYDATLDYLRDVQ